MDITDKCFNHFFLTAIVMSSIDLFHLRLFSMAFTDGGVIRSAESKASKVPCSLIIMSAHQVEIRHGVEPVQSEYSDTILF